MNNSSVSNFLSGWEDVCPEKSSLICNSNSQNAFAEISFCEEPPELSSTIRITLPFGIKLEVPQEIGEYISELLGGYNA